MVTLHAADITHVGWSEATLILDGFLIVLGVATLEAVRRLLGRHFRPILTIAVGGGLALISQVHLLETVLAYRGFVGNGAPEATHRLLVVAGFLWVITGIGLSSRELLRARERAEEQLAREGAQRAKTQAILDHMADGVLVADGEGRILDANPALCTFMGVQPDHVKGRAVGEFLRRLLPPEQPFCPTADDVGRGIDVTVCGREQTLLLAGSVNLLAGEPGQPNSYVVVLRDVSRQHRLDRMKTEFVELVSHELRRPVTNLALAAELHREHIAGLPAEDPDRRISEILLQESSRARALVEDILTSASFEAGHMRMGGDSIALLPIVRDVAAAFAQDQRHGRLQIAHVVSRNVEADPLAVRLALYNLVDNALKYSPPDACVEVSMWSHGDEVGVAVKDHGGGIPADDIETIFERFHRLDSSDARSTYGFGLGLHIARSVTEAAGGRLTVESTVGVGSVFTLVLPLSGVAQPPASLVEV